MSSRWSIIARFGLWPYLPLALAVASGLLLAGAYAFQYWGGLWPCELCLKQRPPHWAALGLGMLAYFGLRRGQTRGAAFLLALMGFILLTGAGIAAFHVGVEQRWWRGPSTCAVNMPAIDDPAAMAEAVMNAPLVSCADVVWSLFGISMAGYNFIFTLLLGGLSLLAAWHWRLKERRDG